MKFGMRKPSLKRSFKARTTGRAKRAVKRALIPGYGKKGTGWIKNPKKAAYNKIYRKTTFGISDLARAASKPKKHATKSTPSRANSSKSYSSTTSHSNRTLSSSIKSRREANTALALCVFLGFLGAHRFYAKRYVSGIVYFCTFGLFGLGWFCDILILLHRRSKLISIQNVTTHNDEHDETAMKSEQKLTRSKKENDIEQESRRSFMVQAGVKIDTFTPTKAIEDSLDVISKCVPSMMRFEHEIAKSESSITISSPTSTGKVPKNVAEAHVHYNEIVEIPIGTGDLTTETFGDLLSIKLSYLSNGLVNKADITIWHRHNGLKVNIRRKNDELKVTGAQTCDSSSTGKWQGICRNQKPTSDELVTAIDAIAETFAM